MSYCSSIGAAHGKRRTPTDDQRLYALLSQDPFLYALMEDSKVKLRKFIKYAALAGRIR